VNDPDSAGGTGPGKLCWLALARLQT